MSEWINLDDRKPYDESISKVRILLNDGSEINCLSQSNGSFYWKKFDLFIHEYSVTHWKSNE